MKKTVYLVQHSTGKGFATGLEFGYPVWEDRKRAKQHTTVQAAALTLAQCAKRFGADVLQIVRVDVTPSKSELVITNKSKIDATKPCVIHCYNTGYFAGPGNACVMKVEEAAVFLDLQEALTWMQQRKCVWSFSAKVFNVETQTTAESFTETVLA